MRSTTISRGCRPRDRRGALERRGERRGERRRGERDGERDGERRGVLLPLPSGFSFFSGVRLRRGGEAMAPLQVLSTLWL